MQTNIKRATYKVDASGQILGRLASDIASHLIGKHLTTYQPHLDLGDSVEVVNVSGLKLTDKKLEQKMYYHHSMHPGGIKSVSLAKLFAKDPAEVLNKAVARMLPKNKLRNERLKRLKIS